MNVPGDELSREALAHDLLDRCYRAPPAEIFGSEDDAVLLETAKLGADLLVAARLATFADEGRTQIMPTPAGRYWSIHGGYLAFLKEEPAGRGGGGGGGGARNPQLEDMRMALMKRRLDTFWWSFGLSLAGFGFSIVSLAVALTYGGTLFK